ncbi:MAG: hypothetical protein M1829_006898 [Trizodia sp. TS-e1964]|nr:MAG: hypothetical protein M1829_006898 [Trizodia sp. TS-e1964]
MVRMTEKRTTAGLMDFSWENPPPVDQSSPFVQAVHFQQQQQQQFQQQQLQQQQQQQQQHRSIFETNNNPFNTPSKLPTSAHNAFSSFAPQQPSKPATFATPKKFNNDMAFYSSPDAPSSSDNADTEDTPDAKPTFQSSSQLERFSSKLSSRSNKKFPRRLEFHRQKKSHRDKNVFKVHKPSHPDNSIYFEQVNSSTGRQEKFSLLNPHTYARFISTYPDLPKILLEWLHIGTNMIFGSVYMFLLYVGWKGIQTDFSKASNEAIDAALTEIAACSREFLVNRCGEGLDIPLTADLCNRWRVCMKRDPKEIGTAAVSMGALSTIINSFTGSLTLTSIAFLLSVTVVAPIGTNIFFSRMHKSCRGIDRGVESILVRIVSDKFDQGLPMG